MYEHLPVHGFCGVHPPLESGTATLLGLTGGKQSRQSTCLGYVLYTLYVQRNYGGKFLSSKITQYLPNLWDSNIYN